MSERPTAERWLALILRLGGVLLCTAFAAILLPADTMAAIHRWLGMGQLPRAPIVEYLTRSISALYGFHGVLLFVVAGDIRRYRPLVLYLGIMNVVLGGMLLAIDLHAGLPAWWTWGEGPPLMVVGVALLALVRRVPEP